jgi:hypothetical protein
MVKATGQRLPCLAADLLVDPGAIVSSAVGCHVGSLSAWTSRTIGAPAAELSSQCSRVNCASQDAARFEICQGLHKHAVCVVGGGVLFSNTPQVEALGQRCGWHPQHVAVSLGCSSVGAGPDLDTHRAVLYHQAGM